MKVFLIFGLLMGLVLSIPTYAASAKTKEAWTFNEQNLRGLELSIILHKHRYKPTDQITFDVMLTNSGKEAVYIFGTLDWGYSASLILHIRDASGKEIQPLL